MATMTATDRRIYVSCLASYNSGTLHGAWIDADQDADVIRGEIADMLRESPFPNVTVDCPECDSGKCPAGTCLKGEPCSHVCEECNGTGKVPSAEEYAIHDFEGFDGIKLSEHESIDTIAELASAIAEHGEAFAAWYAHDSRDSVDVDAFQESYRGHFSKLEDYAYELVTDCYFTKETPQIFQQYFDFEAFGRDMELGGDIYTVDGDGGIYVFDNH